MNVTLLDHQLRFIKTYDEKVPKYGLNGFLLAAGAGTGKTITNFALSLCLGADKVFFVVPKNSVYSVWVSTIKTRFKKPQTFWVAGENKPYKGQKYLIGHFESLDKMVQAAHQSNAHNPVVVLDESHNFNTDSSQRTARFVELCHYLKCKNVVWASGTPLKAMGFELIPLLKTIDPLFTADAEMRFKRIYGLKASKAVDILRHRIGNLSFKVSKQAVSETKTSTEVVKVKLPNGRDYTLDTLRAEMKEFVKQRLDYYRRDFKKFLNFYQDALKIHKKQLDSRDQRKAFDKYVRDIEVIRKGYDPVAMKEQAAYCNHYELKVLMPSLPTKEMRDQFKSTRSVIKYVGLKVVGEALGNVLGKKRAQCHVDMVPHIGLEDIIPQAAKKTVIFTSYVEVVKATDKYLRSKGFDPLLVYGETNADVAGIVNEFGRNPKKNPIIATYMSLSTAVPLVMANQSIFINQPFRSYEKEQAMARTDRLGQDSPVHYVNVLLDTGEESNISTRSDDILKWSKEQVAAMMAEDDPVLAASLGKHFATLESIEECIPIIVERGYLDAVPYDINVTEDELEHFLHPGEGVDITERNNAILDTYYHRSCAEAYATKEHWFDDMITNQLTHLGNNSNET